MKAILSATTLVSLAATANAAASFSLVKSYSGTSFFDDWDFYGDTDAGLVGAWNGSSPYDDTTNGQHIARAT